MKRAFSVVCIAAALLFSVVSTHAAPPDSLTSTFSHPPATARPWVYWFWLNGNITREGIKDDLEAMQRVGIGGVLIMEVDQGTPAGNVDFGSPKWRDMFKYVCSEAHALGLEVNMNNDAGWCGSAGPWITPELSMKRVVWTETKVTGGQQVNVTLAQPDAVDGFYRDIDVVAFPTPADDAYRIPDIAGKSARDPSFFPPAPASYASDPTSQIVRLHSIVHLATQFDGKSLSWAAPAGNWTVLRLGYTTTGVENHPSPQAGLGLECDKLTRDGSNAQFKGLMDKLVADNAEFVGSSLVSTHIDSWEIGDQNWSSSFREDFRRLRGYDPDDYLPVMTGRIVQSSEVSERFLWDIRLTVSQLLDENYAGNMEKLAKAHGIRLSIEGYDSSPTDDMAYAGRADEPMSEFWATGQAGYTTDEMASAAHTYGKNILGAESFTSDDSERWLYSPSTLKTEADWALCDGINRFVFHRYAMQPWADVKPGMSMGPWGLHYERTETWWEQTKPWHEYLTRCQYMLRKGLFVADICYLQPEGSPRRFTAPVAGQGDLYSTRPGYNYDGCNSEVVLTRMSVKNGLITLPDGMSYRVLALPDVETMTPELLEKIAQLVKAGATVVGTPPRKSPSLSDFPACDDRLQRLAAQLWGDNDTASPFIHHYGLGKVISGVTAEEALALTNVPKDFTSGAGSPFRYIHRQTKDGLDIYFVANKLNADRTETCTFRVTGKTPELLWPESGKTEPVLVYQQTNTTTEIPITLDGTQSVFVVFKPAQRPAQGFLEAAYVHKTAHDSSDIPVVTQATYGLLGDPTKTLDVQNKLQHLIDAGKYSFRVGDLAEGDDPAFGTVKTLRATYTLSGKTYHLNGRDTDTVAFQTASSSIPFKITNVNGQTVLQAQKNGIYSLKSVSGKTSSYTVSAVPANQDITGSWDLTFPPNLGAPAKVTMDTLSSWSDNASPGVRYFSGTANYTTSMSVKLPDNGEHVSIDLGEVHEIAEVSVNGKDLGILWHAPYRVDITSALHNGTNVLSIKVTNLWINRMIGDDNLPPDSDRNGDGTLKSWPDWLGVTPSPTGRITFTTWQLWHKNDPLRPSGLLGPVTLSYARDIPIAAQ